MKNSNFSRFAKLWLTAFVLVCGFVFTACKPEAEVLPDGVDYLSEDSTLIGSWTSTYYENFIITKDTFEAKGSYKGDSLVVSAISDTAGTIFVKYTQVPDWTKGQADKPEDTTGWTEAYGSWYPNNDDLTGKWYGISYKALAAGSVSISGAYKKGGKSAADTLEEALKEFTIENGYFGTYSECKK